MHTVIAFELGFRFRQVSTYVFFGLMALLSFLFVATDIVQIGGGDGQVKVNAPLVLAQVCGILGALGGVMVSALAGTAVYRDYEAQAHELFFTTRLTRRDYFLGRFLGAWIVCLFVYAGLPIGMGLGAAMPWVDPATLGPARWESYASVFALIVAPNVLLTAALFFVFGALTRSLMAIYTLGILLLVGWGVAVGLMGRLDNQGIAALLDPFGLAALRFATRYWSVADKNLRLLPAAGALLTNRLLWSGVALAALAIGYRAFRFAARPPALRRRAVADATPPPAPTTTAVGARDLAPLRLFAALTAFHLRDTVRSLPFVVIVLAGALQLAVNAWNADSLLDNTVWPVTRIMASRVAGAFMVYFLILVTVYAGELVWRERGLKADALTDPLPVPTATVTLAKATALAIALAGLTLLLIPVGMAVQLLKGYTHLEPGLYLSFLFGSVYPAVLCLLALAVFVHTLINQKFLGHTIVLVVFVATQALPGLGLDHKLYLFASGPDIQLSDMNGYGPYAAPNLWFNVYWSAASAVLLALAVRLSVRGKDTELRRRWAVGPWRGGVVLAAAAVFVATGSWIFVNTNVRRVYRSEKSEKRLRAEYERRYRAAYAESPQPRITAASLDVSLFPQEARFVSTGTLRLKNRTDRPIATVALTVDPQSDVRALALDRPWTPRVRDTERGFFTFALAEPLAPGAEASLTFTLAGGRPGFANGRPDTRVVENGSFVTMPSPRIGYQPESELADASDRRREGLPPRPRLAPATDAKARANTYLGNDADWIAFDATVRTDPDQIALAPGYPEKEWTEAGRRCFRYKMDAPIRNFYTFVSARYVVVRDVWTGRDGKKVALEIYHHPGHTYNLDRMLAGAKAGLTYCTENFGPYQFRQLRIVEFPAYAMFAQAFPNTVPYSEGIGFILRLDRDDPDAMDVPFYVTAHEVAHQWWAHQVLGADAEGSEMLSESLAEYSAVQTLRAAKGDGALERYLRLSHDRYLRGRGGEREKELPLAQVQHQSYIYYAKGATVFTALAERIGEKRLNAALARFVKDKGFQEPPYTTAPELMAYLRAATPRADQAYVTDQFERIALYDLRATSAKASGKAVAITLSAAKRYAEGDGTERDAPLDEPVTIALRARPEPGRRLGKIVAQTTVRLHGGTQTVTLAGEGAETAVVDPLHLYLDRDPDDNLVRVTR